MSRSYRDLTVWKKSMDLANLVYKVSVAFPRVEVYGITSQLRRAAVSVPSNIAEGYGRGTRNDYRLFVGYARGSAYEVETQLLLVQSFNYADAKTLGEAQQLCAEVGRMLHALWIALGPKPPVPGPRGSSH